MRQVIKSSGILLLGALVLPATSVARLVEERSLGCGLEATHLAISIAKHDLFERQRARERADTRHAAAAIGSTATALQIRKVGNVAVVDDDGSLVSEPNPLDLSNRGIQFKRKKGGVKTSKFGGGVITDRGEKILIGDDETMVIDLDFRFRFFGQRYSRVFLNSDGNLTFSRGDDSSSERSLGRFLNGPPRIAPFFDDLDPTGATGDGGVYVDSQAKLIRITWFEVPEFDESNLNTFQVTLYASGKVTVAYQTMDAQEGVVGVSPGGSDALNLVDFSTELPLPKKTAAVAERFGLTEQIDDFAVAKMFLDNFKDDYDILIVWADFNISLGGNTFAYSQTLRNEVRGIGREIYDATFLIGGAQRLQTFVQMGDLSRYPSSPSQKFLDSIDSALSLIAHEAGHRFLAFPRFLDDDGNESDLILGRQLGHWSYFFDSDASVLEGNDIRDNGDGTFSTVGAVERYSRLDQYLMGLIAPEEVPDMFYVADETSSADRESNPRLNDNFFGTRVDVSLSQVIAAEGPRDPDWTVAPKTLKTAFLVLGKRGQPVSQASAAKVKKFRKQWQPFFRQATDGNGTVKTKLKRRKS
jgi:hypothetical protein